MTAILALGASACLLFTDVGDLTSPRAVDDAGASGDSNGGPGAADAVASSIRPLGTSSIGPLSTPYGRAVTVPIPAGAREGDTLVAIVTSGGIVIDGAWLLLRNEAASCGTVNGTSTYTTYLAVRTLGAVDGGALPLGTISVSDTTWDAVIVAYAGTAPRSPVDANALVARSDTAIQKADGPPPSPSLMASVSGGMLVTFFTSLQGSAATLSTPEGMTPRATSGRIAVFDAPIAASGATGPRQSSAAARSVCGAAAGAVALFPAP